MSSAALSAASATPLASGKQPPKEPEARAAGWHAVPPWHERQRGSMIA
eukprot:CAMPEP_0197894264 /NCGR_PEP_ID=MMETSP1439-20131203/34886_1 /TAXON_ID=66791 /ORGANISM="Gonyaulax spinifera, Strain CCMP409" /LENGTH=47 /DNA_ID= /DNA_START= /DNA_END= /DNA_ORIENTATION=